MTHTVAPLSGAVFFVTWNSAHHDRMIAAAAVAVVSVVFAVVFFGFLREKLRAGGGVEGLAATAFGGALLFGGAVCFGAGAAYALTDKTGALDPASAQTLSLLRSDVNTPIASAGVGILLLGFGLAILRSDVLPRWLGWVALPFAVIAVVPSITFAAIFVAALWTSIVSVLLSVRGGGSNGTHPPV